MKKLKKILSAVLSAAVALTAVSGLTASAEGSVTGARLRELAESDTLDKNPYAAEILEQTYTVHGADVLGFSGRIGDIIDPKKAFAAYGDAFDITKFFEADNGGSKNFDEAIAAQRLSFIGNTSDISTEYYARTEPTVNSDGAKSNAVSIFVNTLNGKLYTNLNANQSIFIDDENYEKAAELINSGNIGTPIKAYIFNSSHALGVESDTGCYIISFMKYDDRYASYLGKDDGKIEADRIYTVDEYNARKIGAADNEATARALLTQKIHEAVPDIKTAAELDVVLENNKTDGDDSFSRYIGTEPQYSDVTADQAAVTNQMSDLGVITGENGLFRPDDNVTRAETAAMLCRLFEIEPSETADFPDVPTSHWAAGYIGALASEGVINGFEDGTFRPSDSVTYEQAVKMTENLLGLTFESDIWMYGEYPVGNLATASQLGLTDDLGSFDSGSAASRIDMACILSRALDSDIITNCCYLDELNNEIGFYSLNDISLSSFKNGGKLTGKWQRSDEEKQKYADEIGKEYIEKCGGVIDEWNEKTGSAMSKEITLRKNCTLKNANPVPRITT